MIPTVTQEHTPAPATGAAARQAPAPAVTPIGPAQVAVSSSDPAHAPYVHSRRPDGSFTCLTSEEGRVVPCRGFAFRGTCRHHAAALPYLQPAPPAGPAPGSWAARLAARRSSGCLAPDCMERAAPGELRCPRHRHLGHTFAVRPPPAPDAPISPCDRHPDRYAHHAAGGRARCRECWRDEGQGDGR